MWKIFWFFCLYIFRGDSDDTHEEGQDDDHCDREEDEDADRLDESGASGRRPALRTRHQQTKLWWVMQINLLFMATLLSGHFHFDLKIYLYCILFFFERSSLLRQKSGVYQLAQKESF